MSAPPRTINRTRAALLGVVLVAGIATAIVVNRRADETPPVPAPAPPAGQPEPRDFPIPGFATHRYLNTRPEATAIGTAACVKCHPDNHASYLRTTHSRALSDVDPNAEPADGSFVHKATGRTYRVFRKDGQLHHEELLRTEDGKEIGRVSHPVRYLVGSGHFSRTYLVEVDGFLHESPITWYASKKAWDLSPGYDTTHASFERPVGTGCMSCHAGAVEEVGGAMHKLTIHEKAISCENCHGPGSLHQGLHQRKLAPVGETDWTIVNPGKLSRELRDDICAACHQSGPARVLVRGRQWADFRPGLPLGDFTLNYRFENNDKMTVVGHVEQLHASGCYQKSPDLACTTCHDPHQRQAPADPVAFYRQKCVNCHTQQPCRLNPAERLKKEPADNCVACHMPRGDTEIPHIAFTHHRIGKHGAKSPPSDQIPNLIPCGDISRMPPIDQQRNLGLAYLEASRTASNPVHARAFRARARENLVAVLSAGLPDGVAAAGCAEIDWMENPPSARKFAQQALADKAIPTNVRTACLMVLAYGHVQDRDFPAAIAPLEELVRLRRFGDDWRLLGMSYLRGNNPQKALTALQQALAIRPFRPTIQGGLAEAYQAIGDTGRAEKHLEKSRWLRAHSQD